MMTDDHLSELYRDLLDRYFPDKRFSVAARFYPSKRAYHSIYIRHKTVHFKISELFRTVPHDILRLLGLILLAKLFRYKVDRQIKSAYRQYVEQHILPANPVKVRQPSPAYNPLGRVYNLESIFEEINQQFFEGRLQKPILGWSLNNSYTRLGFYAQERNLLVISRIFDSPKVPAKIVRYLIYHEMLHMEIPVRVVNGRRSIHPPVFRQAERRFPGYDDIQAWLKKNLRRL